MHPAFSDGDHPQTQQLPNARVIRSGGAPVRWRPTRPPMSSRLAAFAAATRHRVLVVLSYLIGFLPLTLVVLLIIGLLWISALDGP